LRTRLWPDCSKFSGHLLSPPSVLIFSAKTAIILDEISSSQGMPVMETVVNRDPITGRNLGRDLTGHKTGQLEVIEPTDKRCPHGYRIWKARCSCGTIIERPSYLFVRTKQGQKSCGCGPKGRPRIADNGAHINAIFGHCRQSAKVRGIEFTLTRNDIRSIVIEDCQYCGAKPQTRTTHSNLSGEFQYNGIDRVDSQIGYIKTNCVPCCWTCNLAKGQMTVDQFHEWIKRVFAHMQLA